MVAGKKRSVSVNSAGTSSGNSDSAYPVLSANGRFLAFHSAANDLVANDDNDSEDVFVRDIQTGATTLVSVNYFGSASGNNNSYVASMSTDGRLLIFESYATDLVTNDDTNGSGDVFVRPTLFSR